jgi:hypothetical protein
VNSPMPYRTMLLSIAFGVPDLGADPAILFFINGQFMHIAGSDLGEPIEDGYTPATPAGIFKLGAGSVGGGPSLLSAQNAGIAGFAYFDGLPNESGEQNLADVLGYASDLFQACAAADDMAIPAGSPWTDAFSVRRGLPSPVASWPASLGAKSLTRVGSASLSVEADKPKFFGGLFDSPVVGPEAPAFHAAGSVLGDGTLQAGTNVASVVQNGPGDYEVTFDTPTTGTPISLPAINMNSGGGEITAITTGATMIVSTFDSAGVPADRDFTFMVYDLT